MTSIDMSGSPSQGVPTLDLSNGHVSSPRFEIDLLAFSEDSSSPWNMRDPVLAWLIGTMTPKAIVLVGATSAQSWEAIFDATHRFGVDATLLVVTAPPNGCIEGALSTGPSADNGAATSRHPWVEVVEPKEGLSKAPTAVDLLHLNLGALDDIEPSDISEWIGRLRPGSIAVVRGVSGSLGQSAVWRQIQEGLPSFVVEEADLALLQLPVDGRSTLIDALTVHPPLAAQLRLLAERGEYRFALGTEARSAVELRAIVGRLEVERATEAKSAQRGLAALREEIGALLAERATLTHEVARLKEQLAHDVAQLTEQVAREVAAERERVLAERQDEVDTLAAKVAVTAARAERRIGALEEELADVKHKHIAIENELGAAAHEVQELRSSTSWRVTAGFRLGSYGVRRIAGKLRRPVS